MDYEIPQKRTTRKDLKRKRLYNIYKNGGSCRSKNANGNENREQIR
jgi:hypothetical protein